eukprot:512709-Alexandrium_andersonii.AAC.1
MAVAVRIATAVEGLAAGQPPPPPRPRAPGALAGLLGGPVLGSPGRVGCSGSALSLSLIHI